MKIQNVVNKVASLLLIFLLQNMGVSSAWGAEEKPHENPESFSSLALFNASDYPKTYPTDMSKKEWDDFINKFKDLIDKVFSQEVNSKGHAKIANDALEHGNSKAILNENQQELYRNSLDSLGESLNQFRKTKFKELVTDNIGVLYNASKNTKGPQSDQLKQARAQTPFFEAIAGFEEVIDELKTCDRTYNDAQKAEEIASLFTTFQRVVNRFRGLWGIGEKQEHLGSLFCNDYRGEKYHLYYMRDERGVIPFTIHEHGTPIKFVGSDEGLYLTYIPYGGPLPLPHHERTILFSNSSNNTIKIEERLGIIFNVNVIEDVFIFSIYTGAHGNYPYTRTLKRSTGVSVRDIQPSNVPFGQVFIPTASFVEEKSSPLLTSDNIGNPAFFQVSTPQNEIKLKFLEEFLKKYLVGEEERFFPLFINGIERNNIKGDHIEGMEADYLFLLDLAKRKQDNPEDENVLYTETLVQEAFRECSEELSDVSPSLEDIIKNHEELLKQKYEEEIRREQEEHSRKVAGGYYNSEEKSTGKPQKSKSKKGGKGKRKEAKPNTASVRDDVVNKAQARLRELKEGKKQLTYKNYLELINVVMQGFRLVGIDVKGYLNGSSHGAFVVENKKFPHVRPHGGGMILRTDAIAFCEKILNCYFNAKWNVEIKTS